MLSRAAVHSVLLRSAVVPLLLHFGVSEVNERTVSESSVVQSLVSSSVHHVSERTVSQRVVGLGGVNSESSCRLQFTT
ncbi:unnamed protein product [Boreogadus saida]